MPCVVMHIAITTEWIEGILLWTRSLVQYTYIYLFYSCTHDWLARRPTKCKHRYPSSFPPIYISHENLKAMERRACHIIEITRREKSDAGQEKIFWERTEVSYFYKFYVFQFFESNVSYNRELGVVVLEGAFKGYNVKCRYKK